MWALKWILYASEDDEAPEWVSERQENPVVSVHHPDRSVILSNVGDSRRYTLFLSAFYCEVFIHPLSL